MMEFMTIEEMRTRFPTQWLLIGDPQMDDMERLSAGTVLWHSENRDELHEKARQLSSQLVAIRCFREPPEKEFFCLSPLIIEEIDELEMDRLQRRLPMHVAELRRLMHKVPFQPFIIHMDYGRQVRVQHLDFIATSPKGHSAVVFQDDRGYEIIDLLLVASFEVEPVLPAHQ
jgi:hypothetical protein